MPGFTANRSRCQGIYCATCSGVCGLGPTSDIEPVRILMSWGNSSICVTRRKDKTCCILLPGFSARVFSLMILKCLPFLPTRSWTKKGFSHKPIQSHRQIMRRKGKRISNRMRAKNLSEIFLINSTATASFFG